MKNDAYKFTYGIVPITNSPYRHLAVALCLLCGADLKYGVFDLCDKCKPERFDELNAEEKAHALIHAFKLGVSTP